MSIIQNIEETVFFDEAHIRELWTSSWNEMDMHIRSNPNFSMCIEDIVDSVRAHAHRIVGDVAYDRAGML